MKHNHEILFSITAVAVTVKVPSLHNLVSPLVGFINIVEVVVDNLFPLLYVVNGHDMSRIFI